MEILSTVMLSSAVNILIPALKQLISEKEETRIDTIIINGKPVKLSQDFIKYLETIKDKVDLTEADIAPSDLISLSRQAIAEENPVSRAQKLDKLRTQEDIGIAALALSPEAVFKDARKRIDLVFKMNLAIAISLAAILIFGIAGAIVSAVFINQNSWVLAFGGISAADLIGVYVFKPLKAINQSLIATQRLDGIYLRLHDQLRQCAEYSSIAARVKCQTATWEAIQDQLAALSEI